MTLKQQVYNAFLDLLEDKITALKQQLADLKESATNETKSTAGDKHETALAMLQIEQANYAAQMDELLLKKKLLEKLDPSISKEKVFAGSLVTTNRGIFYVSAALGKVSIEKQIITAVSPQSPMGNKILGTKADESFVVNQIEYILLKVE